MPEQLKADKVIEAFGGDSYSSWGKTEQFSFFVYMNIAHMNIAHMTLRVKRHRFFTQRFHASDGFT